MDTQHDRPKGDKSKTPEKPSEQTGIHGGRQDFEGDRSDRESSGRPVELPGEGSKEPGRPDQPGGGRQEDKDKQDRRYSEGQPIQR